MNRDTFDRCFARLAWAWNLDPETVNDYFAALQSIPDSHFEEVCDAIFAEEKLRREPVRFLEPSAAIGDRRKAADEELASMSEEDMAANRRKLAQMVRDIVRPVSKKS